MTRSLIVICMLALAGGAGCKEKHAESDTPPGCVKDTDCKGDRVCVRGECKAVPVPAPATAAPAAPSGSLAPAASSAPAPAAERAVVKVPPGHSNGVAKDAPGAKGKQIALVPAGTPVQILRRSEDGMWVFVRWPSALPGGVSEGWMHRDLLDRSSDGTGAAVNCGSAKDATCSDDLLVQLASVGHAAIPADHDFPQIKDMLRGHSELKGTRLVVATREGKNFCGATLSRPSRTRGFTPSPSSSASAWRSRAF
jgi:hypothetical protein